jgi:hypothetical protein
MKGKAVELPLAGDQWKQLLKTFADSKTGDRVDRWSLIRALDLLPLATDRDQDSRTCPRVIELDESGFGEERSPVIASLNQTLRNLSRRLRERVGGPKGKPLGCLRVDGEEIHSGFVVRYLFQDDSRNLRFGQRKDG